MVQKVSKILYAEYCTFLHDTAVRDVANNYHTSSHTHVHRSPKIAKFYRSLSLTAHDQSSKP